MTDRTVRDVRTMTDAEVFAALAALPARFRFEVGRITLAEPDPDLLAAAQQTMPDPLVDRAAFKAHEEALSASVRPRQHWTLMIAAEPAHGGGPAFYGRAPTLAEAYLDVRTQIAAFTEAL
jgi:hypothetical protein